MENLFCNLSEEEFSRGRKALLWIFSAFFFVGGLSILYASLVVGQKSINPLFSIAPFGISLVVFIIACIASFKGTNLFFSIDNEKIEYKFGFFKPTDHLFKWTDIKELVMPNKQKKVKLVFKDGSRYIINLTWIQRKKTIQIMKHIYHTAREKDINVKKVSFLTGKV